MDLRPVQSLSACTRVTFSLLFKLSHHSRQNKLPVGKDTWDTKKEHREGGGLKAHT
jgi:hypothetical protein